MSPKVAELVARLEKLPPNQQDAHAGELLGRIPAPESLSPAERAADLAAFFQSRGEPESDDEAAAEELFRNIDAHRLSSRPLFPPEKKGVTW